MVDWKSQNIREMQWVGEEAEGMWSRVIFLRDGVHSQTHMEKNAEKS